MRLEITKRADLAVRAMALLAEGRQLKAAELAVRLETTPGFVPQIIGPLVKAGWIRSDPGPTGGYLLAAPPSGVSVLDVIEAVDGPTDSGQCVVAAVPCGRSAPCALHSAWAHAREQLIGSLETISVADVSTTVGVSTR
jgi:Rrf2 family protein